MTFHDIINNAPMSRRVNARDVLCDPMYVLEPLQQHPLSGVWRGQIKKIWLDDDIITHDVSIQFDPTKDPLLSCSCPDFIRRNVTCKHIIALCMNHLNLKE